jgi:DNA-binding response OmpR family regulator
VRVLVVDDDAIVLASCRRILEEEGFAVVTAASVSDAILAAVEQGFDLIIVDVKMPERDGLELLAHVRRWRKPPPFIVMSGFPTSETVLASLEGGAFVFVPKPFTPDELLASVRLVVPGLVRGG